MLFSAVYIGFSVYNYDRFYWTTRDQLLGSYAGKVNTVHVLTDPGTGNIVVMVDVSVSNPTAYSGLSVHGFELTFFFSHNGNLSEAVFSNIRDVLLANVALDTPLAPKSSVTATLTIHLDQSQSSLFRDFSAAHPGEISAHTFLMTVINSFLNPVFGRINTTSQQDVPTS